MKLMCNHLFFFFIICSMRRPGGTRGLHEQVPAGVRCVYLPASYELHAGEGGGGQDLRQRCTREQEEAGEGGMQVCAHALCNSGYIRERDFVMHLVNFV